MGKRRERSLRDIARKLVEPVVVYRRPLTDGPVAVERDGKRVGLSAAQELMRQEMVEGARVRRVAQDELNKLALAELIDKALDGDCGAGVGSALAEVVCGEYLLTRR